MEPTHEPELISPVDLCTPDGRYLNRDAMGWSRHPLHRCNLRGRWGRTKKWDYWAVLAGDLAIGLVYADVDYLGLASVWWCDLPTGRTGGIDRAIPGARGVDLPDRPGTAPLRFRDRRLTLEITDDGPGPGADPRVRARTGGVTRVRASWNEKDGTPARLEVDLALAADHESLSVVIPWDSRRFQFTTKDQARPATGSLRVGDHVTAIGGERPEEQAWGVLDVGRGRWPYSVDWNWGGGAGRATTGETIGIQVGAKWTDGTGFTENAVTVDGRLHKIGRELRWLYSWDRPMDPWRVLDPGGAIDLTLTPRFDKHGKTDAGLLRTEVHQVFGTWTGTVAGEDGRTYTVDGVQGFAEESRNRW